MTIELDLDVPLELTPLMWMIGRWQGAGVIGYPDMVESRFGQEVEFAHDGRDFLSFRSATWLLDEDGEQVRPLACETGYWRPVGGSEDGGTALEVLVAHPIGVTEIYLGRVLGARVDLATDLVARTETAEEYSAARRMYGLVEGDLLWVLDMAARGHPLQAHASARLKRV